MGSQPTQLEAAVRERSDDDFIDEILIDIKMLRYDVCACEWY
jgi:hypothetical protein